LTDRGASAPPIRPTGVRIGLQITTSEPEVMLSTVGTRTHILKYLD
jgi:hypothetical protein